MYWRPLLREKSQQDEDLSLAVSSVLSYKVYLQRRLTIIMENKQGERDSVDRNIAAVVCVTTGQDTQLWKHCSMFYIFVNLPIFENIW